jgi:hypothetical protein
MSWESEGTNVPPKGNGGRELSVRKRSDGTFEARALCVLNGRKRLFTFRAKTPQEALEGLPAVVRGAGWEM